MQDSIFREYDIRGIVGTEFDLEKVYDLGSAIAQYFSEQKIEIRTVLLGRDARPHSPYIQESLTQALLQAGFLVIDAGLCSSPVIYFGLHTHNFDAGIIVTASHNGAEYNGLKICLKTVPLSPQAIQELKMVYKQKQFLFRSAPHVSFGFQQIDLVHEYVQWMVDHFMHLKNCIIPVLFDCGNGTTGPELQKIIDLLHIKNVELLYAEPDGTFPHHPADPSVAKNMQEVKDKLATGNYWFGIGLDGDGDRMGAMTVQGNLVAADQLLALFAQEIFADYSGDRLETGVVFDIRSSQGLVNLLRAWGTNAYWSPAGHSHIKKIMKEHNAVLGGELSCHFMFRDRYFGYDDAVYAALRLIELVMHSGKKLEELLLLFPLLCSSAEIRLQCSSESSALLLRDIHDIFVGNSAVVLVTIDGKRVVFSDGWGLVRKSNTQPAISMRFESDSAEGLVRIKQIFFGLLQPYFSTDILHKALEI